MSVKSTNQGQIDDKILSLVEFAHLELWNLQTIILKIAEIKHKKSLNESPSS